MAVAKFYGVDPDVVEYEWTNRDFIERMWFMQDYIDEENRRAKEAEARAKGKQKGSGVTWQAS